MRSVLPPATFEPHQFSNRNCEVKKGFIFIEINAIPFRDQSLLTLLKIQVMIKGLLNSRAI